VLLRSELKPTFEADLECHCPTILNRIKTAYLPQFSFAVTTYRVIEKLTL